MRLIFPSLVYCYIGLKLLEPPQKFQKNNLKLFSKHKESELSSLRDHLKKLYPNTNFSESYIKGTGPGGQKINKSNSCVQLIYHSSITDQKKIVIKCQSSRDLLSNRIEATHILLDKIRKIQHDKLRQLKDEEHKKSARVLKLRPIDKQKKLISKTTRSQIKSARSKIIPKDYD